MPTADIRKAAILLLSLPEDQAAGILSKLEPKQVEAVSIEIAKNSSLTADEQQAVILEFANTDPKSVANTSGGLDVAKSLVEKAFGEKHEYAGEYSTFDRGNALWIFAERRYAESADLFDRRAPADDCLDPFAPAAILWGRSTLGSACRSAAFGDPANRNHGADESRDHSRG